jgi:DNA-binding transcriptional LysR family regulator
MTRREMPERTIELASYHAMLGCVVAGMGIALIPKSVLTTFPERKRLSIHLLARTENRAQTVLICRKGSRFGERQGFAGDIARPQARIFIKNPDNGYGNIIVSIGNVR